MSDVRRGLRYSRGSVDGRHVEMDAGSCEESEVGSHSLINMPLENQAAVGWGTDQSDAGPPRKRSCFAIWAGNKLK